MAIDKKFIKQISSTSSVYVTASSLGTNGYVKFSNGLKIVWGKTSDIISSNYRNKTKDVSFSSSFTNTVYTVIASLAGGITNGDVKVKSMSTSGFTAFIDNLVPEGSGGAIMSGTGNITYIAIGKDN